MLEEGCRVAGRFRIAKRLEVSGECHRFDAWDERNERWVKLVMRPEPSSRDARLVHPSFAQPEELGCIGSGYLALIDPGEGEAVGRLMRRLTDTPLDLESLMLVGLGLCEALHHVARWDLAHGDLGGATVHVTPDFDPIIMDFNDTEVAPLSPDSIPFASPERQLGRQGDTRSDIYAIGAILYTLRVGKAPFGWDLKPAREGHLYHQLAADPKIPGPIMKVLRRAMEKPARLRYSSMTAFASALTEAYELHMLGAEEGTPLALDPTTEIPLEEITQPPQLVLLPDPETDWEVRARPVGSAGPLAGLVDRTIELSDDMLDYEAMGFTKSATGSYVRRSVPSVIPKSAPPPSESLPYFDMETAEIEPWGSMEPTPTAWTEAHEQKLATSNLWAFVLGALVAVVVMFAFVGTSMMVLLALILSQIG